MTNNKGRRSNINKCCEKYQQVLDMLGKNDKYNRSNSVFQLSRGQRLFFLKAGCANKHSSYPPNTAESKPAIGWFLFLIYSLKERMCFMLQYTNAMLCKEWYLNR